MCHTLLPRMGIQKQLLYLYLLVRWVWRVAHDSAVPVSLPPRSDRVVSTQTPRHHPRFSRTGSDKVPERVVSHVWLAPTPCQRPKENPTLDHHWVPAWMRLTPSDTCINDFTLRSTIGSRYHSSWSPRSQLGARLASRSLSRVPQCPQSGCKRPPLVRPRASDA